MNRPTFKALQSTLAIGSHVVINGGCAAHLYNQRGVVQELTSGNAVVRLDNTGTVVRPCRVDVEVVESEHSRKALAAAEPEPVVAAVTVKPAVSVFSPTFTVSQTAKGSLGVGLVRAAQLVLSGSIPRDGWATVVINDDTTLREVDGLIKLHLEKLMSALGELVEVEAMEVDLKVIRPVLKLSFEFADGDGGYFAVHDKDGVAGDGAARKVNAILANVLRGADQDVNMVAMLSDRVALAEVENKIAAAIVKLGPGEHTVADVCQASGVEDRPHLWVAKQVWGFEGMVVGGVRIRLGRREDGKAMVYLSSEGSVMRSS